MFDSKSTIEATKLDGADSPEEFHRSENSKEQSPADVVAQFVANRSRGVVGEVESTVVLANGLKGFKNDAGKLQAFLGGLRDAKALSEAEAADLADNKSPSRVSMLTTVAEYRDDLLDPRICPFLSSGTSTLYQIVLLIKEVKKGQEGLDRVADIFSECDGDISRSWVEKRRKKLRTGVGLNESPDEASEGEVAEIDPNDAPSIQSDMAENAVAEAAVSKAKNAEQAERLVTALLITATDDLMERFGKDLEGRANSPCVKISGDIGANAVLIVDATAKTLLSMSTIIGSLGFSRCVQAGLLSDPVGHDLASSRVMAVFSRGNIELPTFNRWHTDADAATLAGQMLEGIAGRHVHLFADAETEGWESVIGEANWQR